MTDETMPSERALAALTWLANERTIDEVMNDPRPPAWVEASAQRRIQMMGERKRAHDAAVLDARAALAEQPVPAGGWRTMDSAPDDGEQVLLWLRAPYSRVALASWCQHWNVWLSDGENYDPDGEIVGIGSKVPSHWQPLQAGPAAPAPSADREGE
jgi:hypothetical protein